MRGMVFFFDVYLYTKCCIVIHVVWISLILKKWYKSGDVVLIYRLFWIASGEYMLVFV